MTNVRAFNGLLKVTTTYFLSLILGVLVGLVSWLYVQRLVVKPSLPPVRPVPTAEVGPVTPSNPTLPRLSDNKKPPVKKPGKLVKTNVQKTKVSSGKGDSRKQPQRKQPVARNNQPPKVPNNTGEQDTATNPPEVQTDEPMKPESVPVTKAPDTAITVPPEVFNPVQLIRNRDFGSPNASDKMPDDWQQFHIGGVQTVTIKKGGDIPTALSGNVVLLDGVEKNKYYPGIYQVVDCPKDVYAFEVKLRYMHYDDEDTKRVRAIRVRLDLVDVKGKVIVDVGNGLWQRLDPSPNGKLKSGWIYDSLVADFSKFRSEYDSGLYRLRISITADSDFGRVTNGEGLYIDSVELWTKPR